MTTNPFSEQGMEELARFARRVMHAYAMPPEDADAAVLERCTLRDAAWAVNALAVALDARRSIMGMFDAVAALGHPRLSPTAEAARRHFETGDTLEDAIRKEMPFDPRVPFLVGCGERMGRLDVVLRGLGALLAWEGGLEHRHARRPDPQSEADKQRRMRFEGAWATARLARSLGLMFELEAEPAAAFRACAGAFDEPWKPFLERVADGLATDASLAVLDGPESPLPELFALAVERARADGDLPQTLARLGEYYGGIVEDLVAEA
jgi:type II secretory pathway component PulF